MLAASLLLLQTAIGPSELPPDARLDRPVAFEARIEPLPELLARIGRSLELPLVAEKRMEGLKATIFTPARPARLTLASLASVFDAEWVPTADGLLLRETAASKVERDQYVKLQESVWQGSVERGGLLRLYAPKELWDASDASSPWRSSSTNPRARFRKGELVSWTTDVASSASDDDLIVVRYEPETGNSFAAALGSFGHSSIRGKLALDEGEKKRLWESVYAQSQRRWASDLAAKNLLELRSPLLSIATEARATQSGGWASGRSAEVDVLARLYARSGVPIVAEANRVAVEALSGSETAAARVPTSFGDLLRGPGHPSGAMRIEFGTLLQRPEGFLEQRVLEPPEPTVRRFENLSSIKLDDLAQLFRRLSPPVAAALGTRVARRDLSAYVPFAAALQIWGALSQGERRRLMSGETVNLTGVAVATRRAVESATSRTIFGLEGKFRSGSGTAAIAGSWSRTIVGLLTIRPGREFALALETSAASIPTPGAPNPSVRQLLIIDANGFGLSLPLPDAMD